MQDQAPALPAEGPAVGGRRTPFLALSLLLLLVLGVVEVRTPSELSFSIFYFVPVVVSTWYGGRAWGAVMALFAALTYLAANYASSPVFDHIGLRLWTTFNELVGNLFLGYLTERLRVHVGRQEELRRKAEDALAEVQQLEEMLPVCSWCRKVRDDKGYWRQLEAFLAARGKAKFSHGICPSCAEQVRAENPDIYPPAT